MKTGLTGRTVLLPSEDVAAYEAHIKRFETKFQPIGERETQLVQNLADTQWRLDRIPSLEFGFFALGRIRYAELFAEVEDPQVRAALLDAHIFTAEGRHFKNLHLQEARLRRQREQDLKELKELQVQRRREEEETAKPAVRPIVNGFEFTDSIQQTKTTNRTTPAPDMEMNSSTA